MKSAFEEWYKKKHPLPPTIEPGPVAREFKKGCKESWKEALKWALNHEDTIDGVLDHYLLDYIKEELENL